MTGKSAGAKWQEHRRMQIDAGTWQPFVSTDRAMAHLHDLRAAGMSSQAIAEAAGIAYSQIARLLWSCSEDRKKIRHATEAAILSVQPINTPDHRKIDSTIGARRRIEALAAIGWRRCDISAHLGVSAQRLGQIRDADRITAKNWRAIRDVFDELSGTPGPSEEVRRRAMANGWAPPLAWDDIDDPDETPVTGQSNRGHLDLDEWLYLVQNGEEPNRAAARCGVQITAVERAAHRHGRPEIAQMASSARIRAEGKAS